MDDDRAFEREEDACHRRMARGLARRGLRTRYSIRTYACVVCKNHAWIAVQHHIAPVAFVSKEGCLDDEYLKICGGSTVWLCPNHHALCHKIKHFGPDQVLDDVEEEYRDGFRKLLEKMKLVVLELRKAGKYVPQELSRVEDWTDG